jgi:hypothetical protein
MVEQQLSEHGGRSFHRAPGGMSLAVEGEAPRDTPAAAGAPRNLMVLGELHDRVLVIIYTRATGNAV